MTGARDDNGQDGLDLLIEEYGAWLRREASVRAVGAGWREVTLPVLDRSNDQLCFYVRDTDGVTEFTDDGYTMAALNRNGVDSAGSRRERADRMARRFGATVEDDGQIMLRTEGNRPDAMNRFVQALTDIGAMAQPQPRQAPVVFADDVAARLDECGVFYTPSVSIRGISGWENSFDFLFQRSANHPTRFCQAPNHLDRNVVRRIMFGWNDTSKAPERTGSRLVVIGDDRREDLQDGVVRALRNYGVTVIPWSQLAERAPAELSA